MVKYLRRAKGVPYLAFVAKVLNISERDILVGNDVGDLAMAAAAETLPASRERSPGLAPPATPTCVAKEKHTVHWFRKGLRLHDNPALLAGLAGATTFRCVFIIDPWFASSSNVGINKWR